MKWKNMIRSGLAILCCASMAFSNFGFIPSAVKANDTTPTPPTFEEITFEDFGIEDGTYGYTPWIAPNGTAYRSPAAQGSYAGGIKNKTFVGKMNFSSTSRTCLIFGGKTSGELGFSLGTWSNGALSYWDQEWKFDLKSLSGEAQAGAIGQLQTVKISFEVFDKDTDGADDIRIWLYFGDVLYGDGPLCELTDYADSMGNYLGIITYSDTGSTVTVESVKESAPTQPIPPTFEEITFEDFGIEDGTYGYTPWIAPNGTAYRSPAAQGSYAGGIKNKTFVGKMNFSSTSRTCLIFGGKSSGELGFSLGTWSNGALSYWDQEWKFDLKSLSGEAQAGAIGQLQTVKISFEVFDKDTDGADDIRIWLYFGDVLYGEGPLCELTDYADSMGNYLGIITYEDNNSTVTVESVKEPEPSVPTPPNFTEITFSDFEIANGEYGKEAGMVISKTVDGGFANKTFVGKVNFTSKSRTGIHFGGQAPAKGEGGIRLITWTDGRLYLAEGYERIPYIPLDTEATTGVIGNEQIIKLSFEVTDTDNDGNEDDVRLWLYFGDELYNDGPLYEAVDYAQYLGNYLGICCYNNESSVTVASVGEGSGTVIPPGPTPDLDPTPDPNPITPPTFEEITFKDYGVANGIYESESDDLVVEKTYSGGLANKTFVGKVKFSDKARTSLNFGGYDSGWKGVALGTWTDGRVWFWEQEGRFSHMTLAADATTGVIGQEQTVKLSFEVADTDNDGEQDDVRFWLYFGDVLYNDGPLYEAVDYAQYLGNYFGVRCYNVDSNVTIISKGETWEPTIPSEPTEPPTEPTLPEITFSDFEIENGTYSKEEHNGCAASGFYREGMADKTFIGTVNFNGKPLASIQFGGTDSEWKGVRLMILSDGNLYFMESEGLFKNIKLSEEIAGTQIVGADVKVKLTIEIADIDGDGEKDDVRYWLSFNDKLYNNKPIKEVIDYAHKVGKRIGIYASDEAAKVSIQSAKLNRPAVKVDFSIMGFTENWEKEVVASNGGTMPFDKNEKTIYTGDATYTGFYIIICVVALTGIGFAYCKRRI